MIEAVAKIVAAYLLGNVMGGQIAGRFRGVDLRTQGSGNIGATNALRTQGRKFALLVLAIDVGKGVVATLGSALRWGADAANPSLMYACGAAVVIGHCYPALHGFRGGKGVATLAGVYAVVLPALAFAACLLTFVAIVIATGYVSLATLASAVAALFYVACVSDAGVFSAFGAFAATITALVLWKHRANWGRLWRGTEHRFEKARVVHRWLRR